jgi:hypothetical protein
MVHHGGYTTLITAHGDTAWIPPPHLDHGQARINHYHHPDALLRAPDPPQHHTSTDDVGDDDVGCDAVPSSDTT